MTSVVAKKYVKALMETVGKDEIRGYYENLLALKNAYSIEKMRNIVFSPTLKKEEKIAFLTSLVESSDDRLNNFIKILVTHDRVSLIPAICDELRYQISLQENSYEGKIISSGAVDENDKKSIEEKLSSKFNSTIVLKDEKSDYPGIKIEIEDLGVEISFSIDRLKAQMTEHILKAI